jgi:type II secretory pathway pseudopilin PulG
MGGSVGRQRGFTYIGLLVAVAIMGLLLTLVARIWRTTEQREREQQLLFVGHAYRLAIGSYFASGHRFPQSLQDLLEDQRTPVPRHHLRRLYPDPMTGKTDWTLVLTADGQGIMGVASSSKVAPIKQRNFGFNDRAFRDSDCICLWQFTYSPNRFTPNIGPTTSGDSALTPANTQGQAPKTLGTFTPGTISALPSGGSSTRLPANSPFAPGGVANSNSPPASTDGPGSN